MFTNRNYLFCALCASILLITSVAFGATLPNDAADISGTWISGDGRTLEITQVGTMFEWLDKSNNQKGLGIIKDDSLEVTWQDDYGTHTSTWKIASFDSKGKPTSIVWPNGRAFVRTEGVQAKPEAKQPEEQPSPKEEKIPEKQIYDISGAWGSNVGFKYQVTQNGAQFEWTESVLNVNGTGTISGENLETNWTDQTGPHSATGVIELDSAGKPTKIFWSNGVIFERAPGFEQPPAYDLSGEWNSNIGVTFTITAKGDIFEWIDGNKVSGTITVSGKRVSVQTGALMFEGSLTTFDSTGKPTKIVMDNGVVLDKTGDAKKPPEAQEKETGPEYEIIGCRLLDISANHATFEVTYKANPKTSKEAYFFAYLIYERTNDKGVKERVRVGHGSKGEDINLPGKSKAVINVANTFGAPLTDGIEIQVKEKKSDLELLSKTFEATLDWRLIRLHKKPELRGMGVDRLFAARLINAKGKAITVDFLYVLDKSHDNEDLKVTITPLFHGNKAGGEWSTGTTAKPLLEGTYTGDLNVSGDYVLHLYDQFKTIDEIEVEIQKKGAKDAFLRKRFPLSYYWGGEGERDSFLVSSYAVKEKSDYGASIEVEFDYSPPHGKQARIYALALQNGRECGSSAPYYVQKPGKGKASLNLTISRDRFYAGSTTDELEFVLEEYGHHRIRERFPFRNVWGPAVEDKIWNIKVVKQEEQFIYLIVYYNLSQSRDADEWSLRLEPKYKGQDVGDGYALAYLHPGRSSVRAVVCLKPINFKYKCDTIEVAFTENGETRSPKKNILTPIGINN